MTLNPQIRILGSWDNCYRIRLWQLGLPKSSYQTLIPLVSEASRGKTGISARTINSVPLSLGVTLGGRSDQLDYDADAFANSSRSLQQHWTWKSKPHASP